jgi:hypothetical protein
MSCRGCGASRVVARGYCNACYLMNRKQKIREGKWEVPLVDASPAVEHLERLAAAGVSKQQMVRLTGLHHTTIYRLQQSSLSSHRPPPTRWCRRAPSFSAQAQPDAFKPSARWGGLAGCWPTGWGWRRRTGTSPN